MIWNTKRCPRVRVAGYTSTTSNGGFAALPRSHWEFRGQESRLQTALSKTSTARVSIRSSYWWKSRSNSRSQFPTMVRVRSTEQPLPGNGFALGTWPTWPIPGKAQAGRDEALGVEIWATCRNRVAIANGQKPAIVRDHLLSLAQSAREDVPTRAQSRPASGLGRALTSVSRACDNANDAARCLGPPSTIGAPRQIDGRGSEARHDRHH